jgi:oligo-1,6-glucosidase
MIMHNTVPNQQRKWWKEAVVYEIYPASFKDSNDDGIGDIPGIISKLDYLHDLGIDAIWVAPHYRSPQVDMGYDISDFEDIHEPYGSLEDCQRLIEEVHRRGMRIIFDLVINHTSDLHLWFQESRSSKHNPKRDWYIWKPPKYDNQGRRHPPNNWRSQFTKPAWSWDETTQEYYLHVYAAEQPDLNWENQECRQAIYDSAIRFWLRRGVDGFRIDTVNKYSKVPGFADAEISEPGEATQIAFSMYTNGPRIHEYLQEINGVFAEYGDIMTVGELPNTPDPEEVLKYISAESRELNMVFNFDTVYLGTKPGHRFIQTPFDNNDFKRELTKWQTLIEDGNAWTTVFLENHDQGRSISRFASDAPEHREAAAKMLSMVLCALSGTLFLYQGQEIGMINAPLTWAPEAYKCVRSTNYFSDIRQRTQNDPQALENARKALQRVARDHARVPMQWDSSANAGFCSTHVHPWMPALMCCKEINVADQTLRKHSVLNFWRELLLLRKRFVELFVYGKFQLMDSSADVMLFTKRDPESSRTLLTVANLSKEAREWQAPIEFDLVRFEMIASNHNGSDSRLRPFEARIYIDSSD